MSPTPEDWKRAAEAHGPHNQHFIQVYANPQARAALRRHSTTPLPVGSVIGKDKLLKSDSSEPQGTAFMIKRSGARFKATGGWEFLFFTSKGMTRVDEQACAACHRGASTDYVRGEYDIPD